MQRRSFITAIVALAGAGSLAGARFTGRGRAAESFEITRSKAEWKAMLTDLEYHVMREDGTERAFTSPLDKNYEPGLYNCKGCDLALYSSEHKYDSGTGWPSFWKALPDAIGTKEDNTLFTTRTECHCRRCGSHLGHIFADGPDPTGKRHCINGVSLTFRAA